MITIAGSESISLERNPFPEGRAARVEHRTQRQDERIEHRVSIRNEQRANARVLENYGQRRAELQGRISEVLGKIEEQREASRQMMADMANQVVGRRQPFQRGLTYHVDELTGALVAKVVNKESGDIVVQIPAEELLELRYKMDSFRRVVFDTKA